MKGSDIVATLRGIINTTTLQTLAMEDKAEIRKLLDLIQFSRFSIGAFQMVVYKAGSGEVTLDDDVGLSNQKMCISNCGYVELKNQCATVLLHRVTMRLMAACPETSGHQ